MTPEDRQTAAAVQLLDKVFLAFEAEKAQSLADLDLAEADRWRSDGLTAIHRRCSDLQAACEQLDAVKSNLEEALESEARGLVAEPLLPEPSWTERLDADGEEGLLIALREHLEGWRQKVEDAVEEGSGGTDDAGLESLEDLSSLLETVIYDLDSCIATLS